MCVSVDLCVLRFQDSQRNICLSNIVAHPIVEIRKYPRYWYDGCAYFNTDYPGGNLQTLHFTSPHSNTAKRGSRLCCVVFFIFGPSGVRALPLAAGINEGGHYFRYFSSFLFFSSFLVLTTAIQNHIRGCRRVSNFCMGS